MIVWTIIFHCQIPLKLKRGSHEAQSESLDPRSKPVAGAVVGAGAGVLRGRVTDAETGEPLPGANILLVELQRGAASDIDGNYEIVDIPPGAYTLRVSFVGYRTLERSVEVRAGVQELNLELQPDYTGLEEVVVTGIASRTSKARAEVAVSRINTEELLQQNAYQDITAMVNGKIAGVTAKQATGNVGGGLRFVVRADAALNGDGSP